MREATAEIAGEKGGEGERHGARTPWAEQVANRAYPRGYVDDRIARRVERAFDRLPARRRGPHFAQPASTATPSTPPPTAGRSSGP